MSDPDIDRIVEQAINETPGIPYQPGITDWERQTDYADKVARRAVALTLRAVAEEIKLKWMLPERSISDFSMMLDSQAAAIEKGGG